MGLTVEARFVRYADVMVETLGHADRATPARWYLQGLLLPGQRKSVEPMAAQVHPQAVRWAHQLMHQLVADSAWSDPALLAAVAREGVPVLSHAGQAPCCWIIDDTGVRKYGKHSVGVARQYCGPLGKTDNCQVAVSPSLATEEGSVPLGYRLYLPREWADDPARREQAGVPEEITFATKGELAWQQIEAALDTGTRPGTGRRRQCGGMRINQRTPRPASLGSRVVAGHARACGATPASADQRARARDGTAGDQLSPGDVARRHQRGAVVALRAGPGAHGPCRSPP